MAALTVSRTEGGTAECTNAYSWPSVKRNPSKNNHLRTPDASGPRRKWSSINLLRRQHGDATNDAVKVTSAEKDACVARRYFDILRSNSFGRCSSRFLFARYTALKHRSVCEIENESSCIFFLFFSFFKEKIVDALLRELCLSLSLSLSLLASLL